MDHERFAKVRSSILGTLVALDIDPSTENYEETPRRVAQWLLSHFPTKEEYNDAIQAVTRATFPSTYGGLVTQTGIEVSGLCPHHLMPVLYMVSIGYVPHQRAIGLSKLARLAEVVLSRAELQEDATELLVQTLCSVLYPNDHRVDAGDVAVVVRGQHTCMTTRGAKMHNSVTTTSKMTGLFLTNDSQIKMEFMQLAYQQKGQ